MAFDGDLEQYQEQQRAAVARAYGDIGELFSSKGECFKPEDAEQLVTEAPPQVPSFPTLMFGMALVKDMLDVLDFTVIGVIATFLFSIVFAFALALWSLGKISGGWWKKILIRKLLVRFAITFAIEMIPFIRIVPTNIVFVLLAHYHETKVAKLFNEALERLHAAGVK